MTNIVETIYGKVEGLAENGLIVFKGIPYAAPPIGKLRFSPPVPPTRWEDIYDASKFGPDAPQIVNEQGIGFNSDQSQSEDCLKLNIWTPGVDQQKRPVLFWIHGGGFISGGSSRPMYEGTSLALRGDVVIVSINYRIGILGLLTHPILTDSKTGYSGNWGFLDQIAALQWVHDNIQLFGGDPDNLTIFGESAGGASVNLLMISPKTRGLFRRVISQSGAPFPATKKQGIEAAEVVFKELNLEAPNIDELRDIKPEAFLNVQKKWSQIMSRGLTASRPVLDGKIIPYGPFEAIKQGITKNIELLIGSNRDEFKLFLVGINKEQYNEEDLLKHLKSRFSNRENIKESDIKEIIELFRKVRSSRDEPTNPYELLCAITTDYMLRSPKMRFAEKLNAAGNKSYAYLFTWESPNKRLGSCHALEIPFVFGTLKTSPKFTGTGSEAENLSAFMQDSWISFAQGGGPGLKELESWPEYDRKNRATMIFGIDSKIQNAPREPERKVWDKYF